MAKTAEVELIIRASIETIIQHGAVLMHGEYGVIWDAQQNCWTWDREMFTQTPHCDCVGAFMIVEQPALDPQVHKGDIYDAAVLALNTDKEWLGCLMNGFDDYHFHKSFPDVLRLGQRLRKEYRPVCFDYLALGNCAGVQVSERYREYIREYCLPHREPRRDLVQPTVPHAPMSAPRIVEPASGTFRIVPPSRESANLMEAVAG